MRRNLRQQYAEPIPFTASVQYWDTDSRLSYTNNREA